MSKNNLKSACRTSWTSIDFYRAPQGGKKNKPEKLRTEWRR